MITECRLYWQLAFPFQTEFESLDLNPWLSCNENLSFRNVHGISEDSCLLGVLDEMGMLCKGANQFGA